MSIWWSLHLRREAASVPLARRLLLGTMETAGVDPDISYDLSVALSEACANAVEHGGRTATHETGLDLSRDADITVAASSSGGFRVTAYLDGEMCRIEVTDSGPGFPPDRAEGQGRRFSGPDESSEHGRGLCLIQEIADHASFDNRPGRGGAVVSFDKILKWRTDAPLLSA
ncbi:ATP-binding protein [Streptomyces boluensis]|uniref:ATP-binding protein n=1 Tax=Streptomyces boluensis TaxID=1775135 RepID=A0A964UN07_9ACTN|nr:ATP-binding protein [Streptomyces boluensis]NBE51436.1 ATP-binding protein [Streptomyces boluensis]